MNVGVVSGQSKSEFTDGDTLELARPEYLCEWILSKLALNNYEEQPNAHMERGELHTASLEKRGPSGSRFTTLELCF